LRPLVKPPDDDGEKTKSLSREHTVIVSRSGLVTVTGGKWTTYRAMAEDVLAVCAERDLLPQRAAGVTEQLRLVGAVGGNSGAQTHPLCAAPGIHSYGDEAPQVEALKGADSFLCEGLSEAMVRFAARFEYAISVEDVLARRSRLLFLDARLALQLAARVGQILSEETGMDPETSAFAQLAGQYLAAR
jgi:glycerol-3-phosphate dehydrogenase